MRRWQHKTEVGGMPIDWTYEQRQAIETTGCNLLVAAAAGSGKTAVLVERIIGKIMGGKGSTDIDRLFVTTFTNAAAAKMRCQVADAISARLLQTPNDKNLQRQHALVNHSYICNLHSFCLNILRQNFHLLDIDPDFGVADVGEIAIIKREIANQLFEDMFEDGDSGFYELAQVYGTQRGYDQLLELLLKMHEFVKTMPFSEKWLKSSADMFDMSGDFEQSIWVKVLKSAAKVQIERCCDLVYEAIDMINESLEIDAYAVAFRSDLDCLNMVKTALDGSWDDIVTALNGMSFVRLAAVKNVDDSIKKPVQDLRNTVKKEMTELKDKTFNAYACDIQSDLRKLLPRIHALGELVCEFDQRFAAEKRDRNVMDFNDLEHMCLKALVRFDDQGNAVPSELALSLQEKFDEILVDEYQDTNELQETIFLLISRGNNIFMVGDIKQSIYRFRHTNPMLFKNKKDTFLVGKGEDQKIIMSKNFRSRKEVINSTNFIFRQITSPLVGEIEYDREERLNQGANYPADGGDGENRNVEVHIIDMSQNTNKPYEFQDEHEMDDEMPEPLSSIEAEAIRVCKRIIEMMQKPFMVYDGKDGYRPLKYSDIVILMRATSRYADVFAEVFGLYGIPVFSDTGTGYFMSDEVRLMLSVLEIIDNPLQDIALLAVMRSPIADFNDEELLRIRLSSKTTDMFVALETASNMDDGLAEKCKAFISQLQKWRDWSTYMSTHELIWQLYGDTLYYGYVGGMSGGQQRQANLRLLYERARQFDKTGFRGLFAFINYIVRIKSSSGDMSGAKILGENQNVVRIMSIHKSKGLEFPVVFLCGVGKRFNLRDMAEPVLMHKELGFGPDFKDYQKRYAYPTIAKMAIRQKMRYENLSEELRLLYVAMTRAKEKLILTMTARDAAKSIEKWSATAVSVQGEQLATHKMAAVSSFADWVMPAVMRCKGCTGVSRGTVPPLDLPADFEAVVSGEGATIEDVQTATQHDMEQHIEDISGLGYSGFVASRLEYSYPFERVVKIPTKISVTELKRIHNFDLDADAQALYNEDMIEKPGFIEECEELSAAAKGSVMHFVMQNIDLQGPLDKEGVQQQVIDMTNHGMLSQQQAETVRAESIAAFFKTDMGRRLLASDSVVREMPFEIEVAASDIYRSDFGDEKMLLQGIIDCYFEENGQIILLDYKTDFVHNTKESINMIAAKYATQLDYYAMALEKITKKRVAQKNLYLFSIDCVIECI